MYHAIVRRKIASAFDAINRGDYSGIAAQFAPHHRHVMYGMHALAGERTTAGSTARWYGRLQRLLPGLRFDVHAIAVTGGPARTQVLVRWTDHFRLPDGAMGSNQGVHAFTLRWGRVAVLEVHCDTARLAAYCERMAAAGLAEAAAAPISDVAWSG